MIGVKLSRNVLVIALLWISLRGTLPTCEFPEFLRHPLPGGEERYWLTETRFHRTLSRWDKRLQITVHAREIVAKVSQEGTCRRQGTDGRPVSCPRNELKFRMVCEEEKDGKFIVRKYDQQNGGDSFVCYDFKKRNNNVVQVWKSKHTEDTEVLCKGYTMVRDEWVWVAPKLEEWVACPLQGGYDFLTYDIHQNEYLYNDQEEAYCEMSRRPSRMESECIRGEGLQFTFPEKDCSPFNDRRQFIQLYCWAYWMEDDKMFIILSEAHSTPQFVLRYSEPSGPDDEEEKMSYFYFSPVIPLQTNGLLSDIVVDTLSMVKMNITPSDPGDGICYDESRKCSDHSDGNQCSNTEISKYNYCKKTCGLCNFFPNSLTECRFPEEGSWLFFVQGEPETVTVQDGKMRFSTLGEFICKGVNSPEREYILQYKVFSYFKNGCRPRYSCIEMGQSTDDMFQFRLSPSQPKDESFRLCRFKDDPSPIYGAIRSHKKKNLLPASLTVFNSCALHGEVPVSKDYTNKCYGTLADWDKHQCQLDNVLRLSLDGVCDAYGGHSSVYRELTCLAFSSVQEDYSLLFTKEIAKNNQFSCWLVMTYAESMSYRPWKYMHQLNTTDCNSVDFYTFTSMTNSLLDLKIMSGQRTQICDTSWSSDIKSQNPKHFERSETSDEDRRKQISVGDSPSSIDCETESPKHSLNPPHTPKTESLHVYGAATVNTRCTLNLLVCQLTVFVVVQLCLITRCR